MRVNANCEIKGGKGIVLSLFCFFLILTAVLYVADSASAKSVISLMPNTAVKGVANSFPLGGTEIAEASTLKEVWENPGLGYVKSVDFSGSIGYKWQISRMKINFKIGSSSDNGKMVINLNEQFADPHHDNCWNVYRVTVLTKNPNANADAALIINGKQVDLEDTDGWYYHSVDFEGDERFTNTVAIESLNYVDCGVDEIHIYVDNQEPIVQESSLGTRIKYNELGVYYFPGAQIANVSDPEYIKCRLKGVDSDKVLTLNWDSANEMYEVNPDYEHPYLEEGRYQIDYSLMTQYDDYYAQLLPDFNTESPFYISIYPSADGITFNWIKASSDGWAYIPDRGDEGWTSDRTWDNALLGDLNEGVKVYWKTSINEDRPFESDGVNTSVSARQSPVSAYSDEDTVTAESLLAQGYTKYGPKGMNLRTGNQLHLYIEKNGVFSPEYLFQYSHMSEATGIDTITDEDYAESEGIVEYYTLEGIRVSTESLLPRGVTLIRRKGATAEIILLK